MFKIDNPQNFHFQMKIRAEKVDKSDLRVICPCQLRNPNGTEGMQLSSFKGHSEKKKDKEKDTKHLNWLASLKSAITSVKSVIGITEVNRYWKHKYLFHTKRMTVYVFFPREQPNHVGFMTLLVTETSTRTLVLIITTQGDLRSSVFISNPSDVTVNARLRLYLPPLPPISVPGIRVARKPVLHGKAWQVEAFPSTPGQRGLP